MFIYEDITICDLSLVIDKSLIIADLHLGYEEYLNRRGIMVPKFQYEKIVTRLDNIKSISGAREIIINGDLKHEFGRVSYQENKEIISLLDYLEDIFKKVTLIKGNHDPILPYITENWRVEVFDELRVMDILLTHGHKIPPLDDANAVIIGHEHPCIGLRSGERVEKIKCFLKGDFRDRALIVMPSFNFVSEGSDILNQDVLSPFLKEANLSQFRVYGVENFEVFDFGRLENIFKHLRRI